MMPTPAAACGRLPLEVAPPAARQSRFRGAPRISPRVCVHRASRETQMKD